MSMSYQEAFNSNLSAWARRAGLQLDKSRNVERANRAKTITGESSRMGALFTAAAVHANSVLKMNVDDSMWFGFAVAHIVFDAAYAGKTFNTDDKIDTIANANVDQIKNSILKNRVLIADFAMDLINVRNEERNRPSITNMILAAARGQ